MREYSESVLSVIMRNAANTGIASRFTSDIKKSKTPIGENRINETRSKSIPRVFMWNNILRVLCVAIYINFSDFATTPCIYGMFASRSLHSKILFYNHLNQLFDCFHAIACSKRGLGPMAVRCDQAAPSHSQVSPRYEPFPYPPQSSTRPRAL